MRKAWRKVLVALAAPAVFLVLVETALWIFGVGDPEPFFVPDPANPVKLTRSESSREFFAPPPAPFLLTKPGNGFRVAVIGESTVAGYPYFHATFCDWLGAELSDVLPSRTVEIVNAGSVGWTTFRLLGVLDECLRLSPDVVIWMVGHNEELVPDNVLRARNRQDHPARAALGDALRHLRVARWYFSRAPSPPVNFPAHDGRHVPRVRQEAPVIREQFVKGLDTVIAKCSRAEVKLILTTMPRNARQLPPAGSGFRSGLLEDFIARIEEQLDKAKAALAAKDFPKVLSYADAALAVDSTSADAQWFRACALEGLDRCDEARESFLAAVDLDIWPSRARSWVQEAIRDRARASGTTLVDLQSEFDKHGKCGVAGFEWLLDDVHPNLTGHRVIAGLLLRALVDNGIPVPSNEFKLDKKRPDAAIRASFGTAEADAFAENRAVGYARLFVALLRPDAKSPEGLAAARDAREHLRRANALIPGDTRVELLLAIAEILLDDPAGAARLRGAIRRDPRVQDEFVRLVKAGPRLQQVLQDAGFPVDALSARGDR